MQIELKYLNESKILSIIGNFEINSNITARVFETANQIAIKLRNTKLSEIGRVFKINNIETVNCIEFAGEVYKNLEYFSHEIYIHYPEDKELKIALCEDLNITFKKVK